MFKFLKPKYVKEGELLIKGVDRFLNYRRDLLDDKVVAEIQDHRSEFRDLIKKRNKEESQKKAKELTRLCEGAAPNYRSSGIAENIEVIFVAIAIALGIRAYIVQPFKIPTGSMQPTLNGIIATETEENLAPNPVIRAIDFVRLGRTWINTVAERDDVVVEVREFTRFKFFTFTQIVCQSGNNYTIHAPREQTLKDLGLDDVVRTRRTWRGLEVEPTPIEEGTVLARGFVDTGDQVLVDKMSYHFVGPRRGEVFVFTTNNIRAIEDPSRGFNPAWGAQHYIKRLAGVPGDEIQVKEPHLYVNGERADSFEFRRVMSQEDGYQGYQGHTDFGELGPEEYVALGDNSYNSFDSRGWGTVPEENLVGRAFLVYWPFNRHWGLIR